MSSLARSGSFGHSIRTNGPNSWLIVWNVEYDITGSNQRHWARHERATDRKGALRFCKKWGIPFKEYVMPEWMKAETPHC